MYRRYPDYIDLERLKTAVRAMLEPSGLNLSNRLLLSVGMIAAPILAFTVIVGINRLIAGF